MQVFLTAPLQNVMFEMINYDDRKHVLKGLKYLFCVRYGNGVSSVWLISKLFVSFYIFVKISEKGFLDAAKSFLVLVNRYCHMYGFETIFPEDVQVRKWFVVSATKSYFQNNILGAV